MTSSRLAIRQPGRAASRSPLRPRAAVVVLELIIALPVLIILLLAVIEFGLILATMQHVALASRMGARIAAQESAAGLDALNQPPGSELRSRIDEFLYASGVQTGSCRVILQTNAIGGDPGVNTIRVDVPTEGACDCAAPEENLPTVRSYVRVTVCVPVSGNVPDLLNAFGFSLDGMTVSHSTSYPLK